MQPALNPHIFQTSGKVKIYEKKKLFITYYIAWKYVINCQLLFRHSITGIVISPIIQPKVTYYRGQNQRIMYIENWRLNQLRTWISKKLFFFTLLLQRTKFAQTDYNFQSSLQQY